MPAAETGQLREHFHDDDITTIIIMSQAAELLGMMREIGETVREGVEAFAEQEPCGLRRDLLPDGAEFVGDVRQRRAFVVGHAVGGAVGWLRD